MNLKEKTKAALSAINPFSSGTRELSAAEGHLELHCELVALDTLACAFTRFEVRTETLGRYSADQLEQMAQTLAAKLNYLLEPITVTEADAERCVMQLRSNPPQKESDRTSYYELLVTREGHLSLVRYQYHNGQRDVVPAHVTREVLLRLVGDFAAVVA